MITRNILGINIKVFLSRSEFIGFILDERESRHKGLKIAFANANLVKIAHKNPQVKEALNDFIIVNDGIGIDIASAILYGRRFPANLNGTDFTPAFLRAVERPLKVFLLGGKPGIAEEAKTALEKLCPHHVFVGTHHGFLDQDSSARLSKRIRDAGTQLLLIGMGNPLQELWLDKYFAETQCRFGIAVGAYLDFASGRMPRAPILVQRLHLEWLFRLMLEPRRLIRRYTVEMIAFLAAVIKERMTRPKKS